MRVVREAPFAARPPPPGGWEPRTPSPSEAVFDSELRLEIVRQNDTGRQAESE